MSKHKNTERHEGALPLISKNTDDSPPESTVNAIARAQVLRADAMSQVGNELFEWMKNKPAAWMTSWRAHKRARSDDGAVSRDRIINATQL
jgi:hypothetical protein